MQLWIDHLDLKARGVTEHAGMRYVCDGALPGETISLAEVEQRRQLAVVRQFSLVRSVPARSEPPCHLFGECGGCQLQHAGYTAQLHYKQAMLAQALQQYGAVQPQHWLPAVASDALGYRRRARLRVRKLPDGALLIGFNRKHRSYILDLDTCAVLDARLNCLLGPLHTLVKQLSNSRQLPQLELVGGDDETAVIVRHLQPFTDHDFQLLAEFSASFNVQVLTQSGGPQKLCPLPGRTQQDLHYALPAHALKLGFAATDFIQANAAVNRLLVDAVLDQLQLSKKTTVLELFCGIGNFSLPLARYAGRVIGVELHDGLLQRAGDNARRNALVNVEFIAADLRQWQVDRAFDRLLLDPPREGAIEILKRLSAHSPAKIVYVSCNPQTLARDARYLTGAAGYRFTRAQLVDMFPQTRHIESLAVFEK